ncbi:UDP-glucose 4-epimerase [Bacillus sp. V3-13]|uniref:NAD-dependent epimerase/dehydratase family protein n=1 Tax=Bacillus sp. V3-13 TaxID=2053728 RepID=UPI000C765DD3|nr:NAD-dependent epimerase/dehydratase family protein [Bacillus sp. V3-13]PLR75938.1 UDP-glucose 4-epimerase [Bacillus sp. V3-13]
MAQKVLVTGGCGFIGSHIVDGLLQKGYQVAVVDNLLTGKKENIKGKPVKFFECDILDERLFTAFEDFKPDYVIHQAAQVSVSESIADIVKDADINIKGTLQVIEASRKQKVKRVVFASSAAVYGNPDYLPIDLDHPTLPMSPYGLSKLTVEKYLELTKSLFDLDYTILRYSNVYGPRQSVEGEGGVIAIFSDLISKNINPTIHGDGEQTRDFIYVSDVAKANINALQANKTGTFNVSSSQAITINDLFFTLINFSGQKLQPNYTEERKGDIRSSVLCNKLTQQELGWEPSVSLEVGLKATIEYFKSVK